MQNTFLLSCFFVLLSFCSNAQPISWKPSYIDVRMGSFGSYMVKAVNLDIDNGAMSRLTPPLKNYVAYSTWFEVAAKFKFKKTQLIGIGVLLKNYRYRAGYCGPIACANFDTYTGVSYSSIFLCHEFIAATTGAVTASLENGIQINFHPSARSPNYLRPITFSYIGKFNIAFRLSKLSQIVLSPTYDIAISRFNKRIIETPLLPFGYGIMIGYKRKV